MEREPFTGQSFEDVHPKAEHLGPMALRPVARLRLLDSVERMPSLPDCSFYDRRMAQIAAETRPDEAA